MKPTRASDVQVEEPVVPPAAQEPEFELPTKLGHHDHSGLVRASNVEVANPSDEELTRAAAHRAVASKKARQAALRKATGSTGSGDLHERLSRKAKGTLR